MASVSCNSTLSDTETKVKRVFPLRAEHGRAEAFLGAYMEFGGQGTELAL